MMMSTPGYANSDGEQMMSSPIQDEHDMIAAHTLMNQLYDKETGIYAALRRWSTTAFAMFLLPLAVLFTFVVFTDAKTQKIDSVMVMLSVALCAYVCLEFFRTNILFGWSICQVFVMWPFYWGLSKIKQGRKFAGPWAHAHGTRAWVCALVALTAYLVIFVAYCVLVGAFSGEKEHFSAIEEGPKSAGMWSTLVIYLVMDFMAYSIIIHNEVEACSLYTASNPDGAYQTLNQIKSSTQQARSTPETTLLNYSCDVTDNPVLIAERKHVHAMVAIMYGYVNAAMYVFITAPYDIGIQLVICMYGGNWPTIVWMRLLQTMVSAIIAGLGLVIRVLLVNNKKLETQIPIVPANTKLK
jgi:hypothetical protein